MQERYMLDLDRACELALKEDYGQAMYIILNVRVSAALDRDNDAKDKSAILLKNLERLIEIDFETYARLNGIKSTPENKMLLMREQSKHWERFDSFMYPGGMEQYGLRYVKVPLTLSPN